MMPLFLFKSEKRQMRAGAFETYEGGPEKQFFFGLTLYSNFPPHISHACMIGICFCSYFSDFAK